MYSQLGRGRPCRGDMGVVTSGVLGSRTFRPSLHSLFPLVALVAAALVEGACVQKLPQEEQATSSSGASSVGRTGPQSATPSTSASEGSQQVGPASPGAKDSSAGNSSGSSTSSSSSGLPNSCTAASPDRECIAAAPADWGGPVSLIQGQRDKDVWVCDAHSGDVDSLFDDIIALPAECNGCKPSVRLPMLSNPEGIRYLGAACVSDKESARRVLKRSKCVAIEPAPAGDYVWELRTPVAGGAVKCSGSPISSTKRGVEKKTHFRGCSILREGECPGANDVCVLRRGGLSCVYRSGDHQCPATYSGSRRLLYGGLQDERSCGKCQAHHEPGKLTIKGKLSFFSHESCAPAYLVESLPYSAFANRCESEQSRIDKKWLYVRHDPEKSSYSGTCTTTGWGPQGEVKKTKAVTLCCRDPRPQ